MAAGTSAQVAVHQHDVRALSMRYVGARADGDAHVRAGERRRVVDAVAHHGDRALLGQARASARSLSSGSTPAITLVHARGGAGWRCAVRSLSPVSMTVRDAHGPQLAQWRRALVGFTTSATATMPASAPSRAK